MTDIASRIDPLAWLEAERVTALRSFTILDTAPEKAFDDIAGMAALICRTPMALVNFVDDDRQWFKAAIGTRIRESSLERSFCTQAMRRSGVFVVPDARDDSRFASNPMVCGEPHLRFYAGAVIRTDEGLPLGTVCVLDRIPRPEGLTKEQADALSALAGSALNLLKLRRAERLLATKDEAFSAFADALPHMIWSASNDGRDEYTNKRWYEFTGAPAGASTETGWLQLLHPDDRERIWTRWQHAAATGEPYEADCRLLHHSGEYRWILARALPARDPQGEIGHWFGTYTDIHEWKLAEAASARSRERYRALLETSAVVFWLASPEGTVTHIEGMADIGGLPEGAYLGKGWLDLVHADDLTRTLAAWHWALSSGVDYQTDFRLKLADGTYRWMLANAVALKDPDGTIREWVGTVSDIHDRKQAEERLRTSEERLRLALHAGRMFAWEQDLTTDYITRSQNAIALLGMGSGPLEDFLERVHPDDRKMRQHFARRVKVQGSYTSEFRYILPNGKMLWFGSRAELAAPDRVVGVTFDITDRKAVEEEVWRTANHDSLTGLPNRVLFHRCLDQALANAQRNGTGVSLLLIDLDDFKDVNDTLGHDAGDALLRETAQRLSSLIRGGDIVARLGGDEFAVLVTSPWGSSDAALLAERVIDGLRQPFSYKERVVASRASIGIAAYPDHHAEPAELMKSADIALYRAKAQGRNRVLTYSPTMRREIEARVSLGAALREALADRRIVPFYQPKISLATGKIVGLEALARWDHPDEGILTPAFFGAAFDDADLAPAIRRQLLAQIADDMRRWLDRGLDFGHVAINLSSSDFSQPHLAQEIFGALESVCVPVEHLEVEITETVLLGRSSECVSVALAQLRRRGIRIALDDFGTGYASLMHLKQFPVDHVKIDRTFVKDLEQDKDDEAIVAAVIGLGKSLKLQVTAEGVETGEQQRLLRHMGCHNAQGFLYSPAVPAREIPDLLAGRSSWL